MTYSRDYGKALQYAKAPKESIAEFATQQTANKADTIDRHHNSDHVFADFLEDHDDPRHEIVRRDLQLRPENSESGTEFSDNIIADRRKRFGDEVGTKQYPDIHMDDGDIEVTPLHVNDNIVGHELIWRPTNKENKPNWDAGYIGHFTPDEFDTMMQKLDLPHSTAAIQEAINKRRK